MKAVSKTAVIIKLTYFLLHFILIFLFYSRFPVFIFIFRFKQRAYCTRNMTSSVLFVLFVLFV